MAIENRLSPQIEKHYRLEGIVPGILKSKQFGMVDLRTISKEDADLLVTSGECPWLKPFPKEKNQSESGNIPTNKKEENKNEK